jgi:hypothetical protein
MTNFVKWGSYRYAVSCLDYKYRIFICHNGATQNVLALPVIDPMKNGISNQRNINIKDKLIET